MMTSQAVAEPEEQTAERTKRQPPYHVVLWNDDDHSYEYVIKMLAELFGYPLEKGFLLAREVDTQGRVTVLTTTVLSILVEMTSPERVLRWLRS